MKKIIIAVVGVILLVVVGGAWLFSQANQPKSEPETSPQLRVCDGSLSVVVTVDQWTSIAKDVLGECANVQTIISGTDVEPHDYEPLPRDIALIENADILVVNGLDYDAWALKAAANAKAGLQTLDIGEITRPSLVSENGSATFKSSNSDDDVELSSTDGNTKTGQDAQDSRNPHLWYGLDNANAYATELSRIAFELFGENAQIVQNVQTLNEKLTTLQALQKELRATTQDKKYAATESVANYLANALGLKDETPTGYANASANESEPSIADVNEFNELLKVKGVDYLFYNIQEESEVTKTLRASAEAGGVKVIEVTEQMPEKFDDLYAWLTETTEKVAK
jgi:zinc/manganese transport system substrate-binding protein